MATIKKLFVLIFYVMMCVRICWSLECYNCTVTHDAGDLRCAGVWIANGPTFEYYNTTIHTCYGSFAVPLVSAGTEPTCFVRIWRARSKYAWIIQRGCYVASRKNFNPTYRTTVCATAVLAEAQYDICFCRSDWCNKANQNTLTINITLISIISVLVANIL